jgi:diadenosine tetraphosphate (Ap4A) HIT family hydrolase
VSLYCLGNARGEQQRREMEDLDARGVCLFCPDELVADPGQPIVVATEHWNVTPNEFPYAGTRTHLLLVPREHVTDLLDLSSEAQVDFWVALAEVRRRYDLAFYGLGARNGDCRFTGGTIAHVHVHVVVGDVDAPDHQPVRLKFSSAGSSGRGSPPRSIQASSTPADRSTSAPSSTP